MKKMLYIMPAALVAMLYTMMAILAGGVGGFTPLAWMTVVLPVLAAVLLTRGHWWGALAGAALGAVYLWIGAPFFLETGLNYQIIAGSVLVIYYLVMGLLAARRK